MGRCTPCKTPLKPDPCTNPTSPAADSGSSDRDDDTDTSIATAVGVAAGICCLLGTVLAAMSLWKMAKVRHDLQTVAEMEPGAETAPQLQACLSCPEPDASALALPDRDRGLTPRPANFNLMYETSAPPTAPLPWPPTQLPILLPTGHGPVLHPTSSVKPFEGTECAPVFPRSIPGGCTTRPPGDSAGLAGKIGSPMAPPQGPVPDRPPPSYAETLHHHLWEAPPVHAPAPVAVKVPAASDVLPVQSRFSEPSIANEGGNIAIDGHHDSPDEEL